MQENVEHILDIALFLRMKGCCFTAN